MSNRKKNINVHFMVDADEMKLIKSGMQQSGINNMRAYLLKMAIDGQIIHIELDSVRDMVRLLSNATNNLNQIAKRVNTTGNLYADDISDLKRRYDSLWGQAKEILQLLAVLNSGNISKIIQEHPMGAKEDTDYGDDLA